MPQHELALHLWRVAVLATCGVAILAIWVGFRRPPSASDGALATVGRAGLATDLSLTLLLGPGIALAALRRRALSLSFLWIPGFLATACIGLACWLGHPLGPHRVAAGGCAAVIAGVAAAALLRGLGAGFDATDVRALVVVVLVIAVALGKTLYSVAPTGELYAGTISRTLEVGDRSDARISYHVVQLITNGITPLGDEGQANFLPYTFSTRGPLPGMAAAPVVLTAGGVPGIGTPDQPWSPFDPQGFEAYREMMIVLAITVLLSGYGLIRALRGPAAARFAISLLATTPFVVHETYFTWPKLLTTAFVLVAIQLVLAERPFLGGVAMAAGYFCHPLALLSMPPLALLALWVAWRKDSANRTNHLIRPIAGLVAGPFAALAGWRLLNGSRYTQDGFLDYIRSANLRVPPTVSAWIDGRLTSTENTLLPLNLFLVHSDNPAINAYGSQSPPIIHFFFQYWTTLPFAIGITFFPYMLFVLARAVRTHPWLITGVVVLPFVIFDVYWGAYDTGLMREGLHVWLVSVVLLVAWLRVTQPSAIGGHPILNLLLVLRTAEIACLLLLPAWVTSRSVTTVGHHAVDAVALLLIFAGLAALAAEAVAANRGAASRWPTRDASPAASLVS